MSHWIKKANRHQAQAKGANQKGTITAALLLNIPQYPLLRCFFFFFFSFFPEQEKHNRLSAFVILCILVQRLKTTNRVGGGWWVAFER